MKQPSFAPQLIVLQVLVLVIWGLIKGYALWKSANLKQRNWFIALFVLIIILLPVTWATFFASVIIDGIYLFKFSKKQLTISELKSWIKREK